MPAPTIYYIRHGETAWNAEGRLQGAQDTSLNDLGRKQAVRAGGILADLFARKGRSEQALAYVASPLGRARSTMERVRDGYDSVLADTVAVAHGGTARALMVALGIETPASAADLTIEQGAVYVFRDGGLRKYS